MEAGLHICTTFNTARYFLLKRTDTSPYVKLIIYIAL